MTRARVGGVRVTLAAALAALLGSTVWGCQSLADIEERTLGPCGEYCAVVMRNCVGPNAAFETREKCLGMCELWDGGDPIEPQGSNTVACRLREARLAENAVAEDLPGRCRAAGPEGTTCGGACESYCTLYQRTCGTWQCGSHEICLDKCAALRNRNAFDLHADHDGDTLQCRLVHLINAVQQPEVHCKHAQLVAPTQYCNWVTRSFSSENPPPAFFPAEPDCRDYCRVVGVACRGAEAVYESEEQCLALCPYLEPGEFTDTDENTRGCRIYHAYNALCLPATHCSHAAPSGDGHCGPVQGGNCASYCRLASAICPDDFDAALGDEEACLEACEALDGAKGNTGYSVVTAAEGGDGLACRFLALSRAAEGEDTCAAAFGAAPCD